jgi:hypothetical protein
MPNAQGGAAGGGLKRARRLPAQARLLVPYLIGLCTTLAGAPRARYSMGARCINSQRPRSHPQLHTDMLYHQQAPPGPALQDSTTGALYRAPNAVAEHSPFFSK